MNPLSGAENSRYGGWGDGSHLQREDADGEPNGTVGSGADGDEDVDPVEAMLTKSQKKTYGRRILYTSLKLLSSPFTALLG